MNDFKVLPSNTNSHFSITRLNAESICPKTLAAKKAALEVEAKVNADRAAELAKKKAEEEAAKAAAEAAAKAEAEAAAQAENAEETPAENTEA